MRLSPTRKAPPRGGDVDALGEGCDEQRDAEDPQHELLGIRVRQNASPPVSPLLCGEKGDEECPQGAAPVPSP